MERHRLTLSNHLNNASLIILALFISLLFPYAMSMIEHEDVSSFVYVGVFIFCAFAIPGMVIHINYYLVNRGDVFEYTYQKKEITIYHRKIATTFNLSDIDYVQRSMSWNKAASRSFVLPWEGYNHSYIHLKDGRRFTVTSLLVPDLELPIEKEKIIVKENFYRLAKSY